VPHRLVTAMSAVVLATAGTVLVQASTATRGGPPDPVAGAAPPRAAQPWVAQPWGAVAVPQTPPAAFRVAPGEPPGLVAARAASAAVTV